MFPGKMMIPRFMLFSSKMLRSLRVGCMRESEGSPNSRGVCVLSHGLHSDAPFVGKEDKNLVGWVFIGCREEVELVPTGSRGRMSPVSIRCRERTRTERTQWYPSDSRTVA